MKKTVQFKDLSISFLQEQEINRYEQYLLLIETKKRPRSLLLIESYKIYIKALKSVEFYLEACGYDYEWGINERGIYIQFSYDVFTVINADLNPSMRVLYAANCDEFGPDEVRIYNEFQQRLSPELIERYRSWVD